MPFKKSYYPNYFSNLIIIKDIAKMPTSQHYPYPLFKKEQRAKFEALKRQIKTQKN